MAANLGSLGLIYKTRGDLDKAEERGRQSLKLYESIGDENRPSPLASKLVEPSLALG